LPTPNPGAVPVPMAMTGQLGAKRQRGLSALPNGDSHSPEAAGSGGHEPPKKKIRFSEVKQQVLEQAGSAPSSADMARSTGTEVYALVVSHPRGRTHEIKKKKSASGRGGGGAGSGGGSAKPTFSTTSLRVILGRPDPGKNVHVDESTGQVIFTIPDPDALAAALQQKEQSESKEYVEVTKTQTYSLRLFDELQYVGVPRVNGLPDVMHPSIVRLTSMTCSGRRGKPPTDSDGKVLRDKQTGLPLQGRI